MSASVCVCGHWQDGHLHETGSCTHDLCPCSQYEYDRHQTREAYEDDEADRLYDAMMEYDR